MRSVFDAIISAWNKIRPVLVKLLQEHKVKRLEAVRSAVVKKRLLLFHDIVDKYKDEHFTEILPPIADLCGVDEIYRIIEADSEIDITSKSFATVVEKFPQFAGEWRHAKDLEILKHLPAPQDETVFPKGDVSRVDLAANTWRCWSCEGVLTYPGILVHACLFRHVYHDVIYLSPDAEEHCSVLDCFPWNYKKTTINERMNTIARHIITECGLDPSTAKTADLDGVWVGCSHPHYDELQGSERLERVMPYANVVRISYLFHPVSISNVFGSMIVHALQTISFWPPPNVGIINLRTRRCFCCLRTAGGREIIQISISGGKSSRPLLAMWGTYRDAQVA